MGATRRGEAPDDQMDGSQVDAPRRPAAARAGPRQPHRQRPVGCRDFVGTNGQDGDRMVWRGAMNWSRQGTFLACVLVLGACTGNAPEEGSGTRAVPSGAGSATSVADAAVLPEGWRWEGFGGVLVAVPGEWGWGNGSQRMGQWCVETGDKPPIVGRPGFSTAVGCLRRGDGVDPSTLISNSGVVVAFEWAVDDAPLAAQGDQEARQIGDTIVRVNAPSDLRRQILGTLHEAEVDANGCAMHLPGSFEPGSAPQPARDVAALTGVTSVVACRYPIGPVTEMRGDSVPVPLFSSLRLDGQAAQAEVAAIAAAPLGGGPDSPDTCLPDFSYGSEMIVARITADQGESAVHVYYSGCDHNGFDDGIALRALTRAAVQPLVAAPNTPLMWSAPDAKRQILIPEGQ